MQWAEFFELFVAEVLASDDDISEEAVRLTGSTSNDIGSAVAVAAQHVAWILSRRMRARYSDTAKGDDLTRLIVSEYGVDRIGATAALVGLVFSRSAPGPAITIEAGTIIVLDGQRFSTDLPIFWSLGDLTDKTVGATAVDLGPAGNVFNPAEDDGGGLVGSIETSLADTTITVTNDARAAGGNEEETDEDYLSRTRDIFARYVRATLRAIVMGALEVGTVRTASVFESLDSLGHPSGGLIVTVADAMGNANDTMVAAVELELKEWAGAGIYRRIDGATVVMQACSMAADWQPGFATPANALALRRAIVARVNKLIPRSAPAGATVDIRCKLRPEAMFNEAAKTVPGCNGVTPVLPVGTVTPNPGEVLRTDLDLVTVT